MRRGICRLTILFLYKTGKIGYNKTIYGQP